MVICYSNARANREITPLREKPHSIPPGLPWWLRRKRIHLQCRRCLGREDPLKEGMATHSSILAWRIPMDEEPGGLQSLGSQRVGHS